MNPNCRMAASVVVVWCGLVAGVDRGYCQTAALPSPPPLPPASLGDAGQAARSAIIKAQHAQASMRAYRVLNRSTDLPAGETLSTTVIFVSPDRYHHIDHEGARRMQTIRIGERGWMKFGAGAWEPELMDSMSILKRLRGPTAIDDSRYELRAATALGARDLKGVKTLAYQYTVVGMGETSLIQLWVSTESGLPVRFEEEFANSAGKQKVSWEVEYDSSLSVEAPVSTPLTRGACETATTVKTLSSADLRALQIAKALPPT